jgi:translation initiation factor 2B subunit (eIF-2B alpha/beta/delta family)
MVRRYDLLPAEYVTMLTCEYGNVPPSSVPVILREQGLVSGGGEA